MHAKSLLPGFSLAPSYPLLSFRKQPWRQRTAVASISTTTHASYSQMGILLLLLCFHFLFTISPEKQHLWLWVPARKTKKTIPIAPYPNLTRSRVSSLKLSYLKRSLFYPTLHLLLSSPLSLIWFYRLVQFFISLVFKARHSFENSFSLNSGCCFEGKGVFLKV